MFLHTIIFIIFLLLPFYVDAKSLETNQFGYGGAYNETMNSVEATKDGGYIAVGSLKSKKIGEVSTGNGNGLIVKYDKENKVEWQQFYGGNGFEEFYDVLVLEDGYVLVGYTLSTDIEGLESLGLEDGLVVKLDKSGNILWQKIIGGSGEDYIHAVKELSNGNLVIVGRSDSKDAYGLENQGALDAFIGILDREGNLISKKLYGGLEHDCFYDLEIVNDYIYVGGYANSDLENHANIGMQDSILIKYDSDLDLVWEDFYGKTRTDMIRSVINTVDGGLLVAGITETIDAPSDGAPKGINGYIAKYSYDGKQEWVKVYGGSSTDSFEKVVQMQNGDYVVVGKGYSVDIEGLTNNGDQESFIVVYDSKGNKIWDKMIGGTKLDILTDVTALDQKNLIAVGYEYSKDIENVDNYGGSDGLIVTAKLHYVITKLPTEHGTFNAIEENEKGKIEINPDEGYRLSKITVKDTSEKIVPFEESEGKYYFELYDDVTVEVLFEEDLVDNPETSDRVIVMFSLLITCILAVVIASRLFRKHGAKFE